MNEHLTSSFLSLGEREERVLLNSVLERPQFLWRSGPDGWLQYDRLYESATYLLTVAHLTVRLKQSCQICEYHGVFSAFIADLLSRRGLADEQWAQAEIIAWLASRSPEKSFFLYNTRSGLK